MWLSYRMWLDEVRPWWWRQQVRLKRRYVSTRLHSDIPEDNSLRRLVVPTPLNIGSYKGRKIRLWASEHKHTHFLRFFASRTSQSSRRHRKRPAGSTKLSSSPERSSAYQHQRTGVAVLGCIMRDAARGWGNGPAGAAHWSDPNERLRPAGEGGGGREATGAWYDEAIISANADTRTRIPFRWVFSFFSLTLDFIYVNEIRKWKARLFPEAHPLFPSSYAEQVRSIFIIYCIIDGSASLCVSSTGEWGNNVWKPGIK